MICMAGISLNRKNMKTLIIVILSVLLNADLIYAQDQANTYVDKKGTLRWSVDHREVNEFGVNYTLPFSYAYWAFKQLNLSHVKAVDEDVYHLTRLGLKAYRIHVWDTEISDTLGNLLDNEHLQLLDYTLKKMKERGFKIILTPIAFWDGVLEEEKGLSGFSHKFGKNNSYSNLEAIKAGENYLYQFMNHVNRYSGIAYKDDPDIVAFEISNEPEHPKETLEETTLYINKLVSAVRKSGCQKPLFYCMSIAPRLLHAFLDADVQGGSVQWYPYSHNGAFQLKGNLLTHVDRWPKDSITGLIKTRNKAVMAYEIDAADNEYAYTYPFMARELRKENVQFATMFSYDPLGIAYSNAEYRTHFMNLAYTPQKALGLKIAGEVFRNTPMGKAYETFPKDTVFDAFRVSNVENLVEMSTDEKFMYSNNTLSTPPAIRKLREISGYGSSPIVQYDGRGAYFLDKLGTGVWRLEVMPDATWVADPFSCPTLDKEVSAIVWNTGTMTINLPDLENDYSVQGINKENQVELSARNGQITVSPGTYLLIKKGVKSHWKPEDKWKDITLNEFIAPAPTTNCYMLHQPAGEVTKGKPHSINVEIISARKPESVKLIITTSAPKQLPAIDFKEVSRYGYTVSIPAEFLQHEGFLKYQIAVECNGNTKVYPESTVSATSVKGFLSNQLAMYNLRIVNSESSVCLLDVSTDNEWMRKPHRRFDFKFYPSMLPDKMGLVMDLRKFCYTSFFFRDKIMGRQADIKTKQKLVLRGKALSDEPLKLWVSLQLKNGLEYGAFVLLTKEQLFYDLPLSLFRRINVIGPGEKGPVYIKYNSDEKLVKETFDISDAETIKLTVDNQGIGRKEGNAVVEYIVLE